MIFRPNSIEFNQDSETRFLPRKLLAQWVYHNGGALMPSGSTVARAVHLAAAVSADSAVLSALRGMHSHRATVNALRP